MTEVWEFRGTSHQVNHMNNTMIEIKKNSEIRRVTRLLPPCERVAFCAKKLSVSGDIL